MRAWTLHLPPGATAGSVPSTARPAAHPALIAEGFAWGAFLFGPFWLWWHRCWLAGALALAGLVALNLLPGLAGAALPLAAHLLLGLHGRDLRRWTLERRGWRLAHVVLGPDQDSAMARLLREEPRLAGLWR